MKLVRLLTRILLLAVLGILVVALGARFGDGPVGPFAGGPLRSGDLRSGADVDWEALAPVPEVELQLVDPPRSRTTHFLVYEGRPYIPCGVFALGPLVLTGQAPWKRWPREVLADPRVILRVDGSRYELRAVKVADPALHRRLGELLSAKYRLGLQGPLDPERAWFYQLLQRGG